MFRYKGYCYWFSVIDACYYKEKIGSFNKTEISKEEFYNAEESYYQVMKGV